MGITIHNVAHGQFISLIHDDIVILWDCGCDEDTRPSVFLEEQKVRSIKIFVVTNYDEDHIRGLPELRNKKFEIQSLRRNKTITGEQLKHLKSQSGPISPAMEEMLKMIEEYSTPIDKETYSNPNITRETYWNKYEEDFNDTNNISVVTFLTYYGRKFIIPGDLEKPGWEKLLEKRAFINDLEDVNVFVASHHGRENGYCEEVFKHCHPDVVVFSDGPIKHDTQEEMADKYGKHAKGFEFRGKTRHVLSTRRDGDIVFNP